MISVKVRAHVNIIGLNPNEEAEVERTLAVEDALKLGLVVELRPAVALKSGNHVPKRNKSNPVQTGR